MPTGSARGAYPLPPTHTLSLRQTRVSAYTHTYTKPIIYTVHKSVKSVSVKDRRERENNLDESTFYLGSIAVTFLRFYVLSIYLWKHIELRSAVRSFSSVKSLLSLRASFPSSSGLSLAFSSFSLAFFLTRPVLYKF